MRDHNSISDLNDTIVAVSTPTGSAPRGIVRMSGPRALDLLAALLPPGPKPALPRANYRSFTAEIMLEDIRVPARIYLMRAPASYTRQDIVELHFFGAPVLQEAALDALAGRGARLAGPGEFTRRAFVNGRLDLAQAEAVEALIHAGSEAEYRAAASALAGHLSGRVQHIRDCLADLAAAVEVSLDFSDQDVDIISSGEVVERLKRIREEASELLALRSEGRLGSQAVRAVLCGPPNAGKSSLFNAILRRRRAIVSPHPGTTRDTIEATLSVNGLEILLVDTAGLRPPSNEVEALSVSRSHAAIRAADFTLCVMDSTSAPAPETLQTLRSLALPCRNTYANLRNEALEPHRTLILMNKCDRGPCHPLLKGLLPPGVETFSVSALDGAGVQRVLERIRERVEQGHVERSPGAIMVNARQADLLRSALQAMERVLESIPPPPMDLVANDIRQALNALSELTGQSVTEDILDRIFSSFCIGK